MLEPATLNPIPDCIQLPPPPITVKDKLEFEISEILYKTTCISKKDYLTSLLYLCSCLLVYYEFCPWTKVSLSLWSIPSQNLLNSLTISQICMNLSSTGYHQGP